MSCDHYTFTDRELIDLSEYFELCEDCEAPILFSCCGDELDPNAENGGFCPSCKEHCI